MNVIDGTWEEIKHREVELAGRMLRVIILPEAARFRSTEQAESVAVSRRPKVLRGLRAFKNSLPSSEQYMREKRAEVERDARHGTAVVAALQR